MWIFAFSVIVDVNALVTKVQLSKISITSVDIVPLLLVSSNLSLVKVIPSVFEAETV